MKTYALLLALAALFVLLYGTPLPGEKPERAHRWESPDPVLPMTFAHQDHVAENCILCHHNYIDDSGGSPCMYCHVTDQKLFLLFEEDFHHLCRSCHEDKQLAGEEAGPTRVCVDCHAEEDRA